MSSRLLAGQTIVGSLLVLALVAAIRAEVAVQSHKLTASTDAYQDAFGMSVALGSNTALIGAPGGGWPVEAEGAAYVFDARSGQQLRKLTALDGHSGNRFGWSVALEGDVALVGAHDDDEYVPDGGAAYLINVTSGQQLAKLTAADKSPGKYFGWSVALNANVALVGANSSKYSRNSIGSAYLFDVMTGEQLFKLTGSNTAPGDRFGSSVALGGNYAIVGAPLERGSNYTGAAYVFDVITGQQLFKFTGHGEFGTSVDGSANTGIVGEIWGSQSGPAFTGVAHLFDLVSGQRLNTLDSNDVSPGDVFGNAVALGHNLALVGAKNDKDRTGSAYLFNSSTGQQIAKLTAADVYKNDQFGESVAVNRSMALVGTPHGYAGAAYLFHVIPEPSSFSLAVFAIIVPTGFRARHTGRSPVQRRLF